MEDNCRKRRWSKKRDISLNALDIEDAEDMASFEGGQWEMLPRGITIDSGAAETVLPKNWCTKIPLRESEASRKNTYYLAANGQKIFNEGERNVTFATSTGSLCAMNFQVCDVTKPLGSVSKICAKGNRVVFDDDFPYIESKSSGERLPLQQRNGVYVLDVWTAPLQTSVFSGQGV